ncbi:hypothetical protein RRSWK_00029 [Rhodopirellula sp. SWK7]|nr:hypothetical protein RRSWK_00029 [Rhodopirellula sp. SWK7]
MTIQHAKTTVEMSPDLGERMGFSIEMTQGDNDTLSHSSPR